MAVRRRSPPLPPLSQPHPLSAPTPSAAPLPPLPPPTGLISNTGFSRAEAEGKTDEELKAAVRAHTAESRQASGATRTGQPQRCGNCGCIHGGKARTCTAEKNWAYHNMTISKRRKLLPNHTW